MPPVTDDDKIFGKKFMTLFFQAKVIKFFKKIDLFEKSLPRYVGLFFFLGFLLFLMFLNISWSGYFQNKLENFIYGVSKIEEIVVEGKKLTTQDDILKALNLDDEKHMMSLNVEDARRNLLSLGWIKTASLQRKYPHKVFVEIIERVPYAIWQYQNQENIIDADGFVLYSKDKKNAYIPENAPLIIGKKANLAAKSFLKDCHKLEVETKNLEIKEILENIESYIWKDTRRWDILFHNKIQIKLPENNAFERFENFLQDDKQRRLLNQNIDFIDLRLKDRMIVKIPKEKVKKLEKNFRTVKYERSKIESQIRGNFL